MALEDLAALRAIHGSTVLYPADATTAAALTAQMADTPGIVYLRTTRGAWPVLYQAGEAFPVGGSKVLRAGRRDEVTLIGAGVTVHQCLRAADDLAADGIMARVIDLYSVKPVDRATLADAAAATSSRLVIAEDHYPQGGLGTAVLEALAGTGLPLRARQCAVSGLPGSGTPDELMEAAGISASHIAAAARELLKD
jgi:transketolase